MDAFGDLRVDDDSSTPVQRDVDGLPAEQQVLTLPSSIPNAATFPELRDVVHEELGLRIGQANDALKQLRLAIAHKSFLYRVRLRPAARKSQRRTARAYDDIKALQLSVEQASRVYSRARSAMEALGADHQTLTKYEVLKKEHINADTTVIDPNEHGHRHDRMSWIWKVGHGGDDDPNWMAERMVFIFSCPSRTLNHVVHSLSCELPARARTHATLA